MEEWLASIPTWAWIVSGIVVFVIVTWLSIAISMWISYMRWLRSIRG